MASEDDTPLDREESVVDPGAQRAAGGVRNKWSDVYGPVSSGLGNQYNYFRVTEMQHRMRRPPRPLGDEAKNLERRFIQPPGLGCAREILDGQGWVLLHGSPGSGRRSAALNLLSVTHCGSGAAIRELPLEQPGDPHGDFLEPDDVGVGDRLLLDLSDGGGRVSEFQHEFGAFRKALEENDACLVVVLPYNETVLIEVELRESIVALESPVRIDVLRRHLHVDGIEYAPGEAQRTDLESWVNRAPLQDIALLAAQIRTAKISTPSAPFNDLLRRARSSSEMSLRAAVEIRKYRKPRLLPLILASAMFENQSVDTIFVAERQLIQALDYPTDDGHDLDRPDLADRLKSIAAEINAERQVSFTSPDYAPAALEYFWVNFPSLRDRFAKWVAECGGMPGLNDSAWRSMAKRFATQSLLVGRTNDLIQVAKRWAMSGRAGVTPAEEILTCGLRHAGEGWRVRQHFYDWSKAAGLHQNLAYLVIALCVQEIAPDQPKQALIRLHHLFAGHADPEVARGAEDALVVLASGVSFFRRLLSRLSHGEHTHMTLARNQDLFLRMADPDLLAGSARETRPMIAEVEVRKQLVVCWRYVLAARQYNDYAENVRGWLNVHANGDGTDPLLDVLVEACDSAVRPLSALFEIGLRWLQEPAADGAVAERRAAAFRRLDAAIDLARASTRDASGRTW